MKPFEPIRYQQGRPMLLAGLRRQHAFAEAAHGIPEQWQQFKNLRSQIPDPLGDTRYGVMCGQSGSAFEYPCGVEVESFARLPGDLGRMRIQAQHYAVFLHRGHISNIRGTWSGAWHDWLANSDYVSAHKPDFEVYDQRFDPQTGLGEVEIWVSIAGKDRAG